MINDSLKDVIDMPVVPIGPRGENLIQTYETQWGILQFHLAVPGLPSFQEAEQRRVTHKTENDTPVQCLCLDDLLASKKRANRPQDQADIEFLELKKSL